MVEGIDHWTLNWELDLEVRSKVRNRICTHELGNSVREVDVEVTSGG